MSDSFESKEDTYAIDRQGIGPPTLINQNPQLVKMTSNAKKRPIAYDGQIEEEYGQPDAKMQRMSHETSETDIVDHRTSSAATQKLMSLSAASSIDMFDDEDAGSEELGCPSPKDATGLMYAASNPATTISTTNSEVKTESYEVTPRSSGATTPSTLTMKLEPVKEEPLEPKQIIVPEKPPPPKRKRERPGQIASIICQFIDTSGNNIVCKQRAILSFQYCIRHILLDPNAPYEQCEHHRKPKNKKDTGTRCTNAIKKQSEVKYCTTHMIMSGLKEAKRKPSALVDVLAPGSVSMNTSSSTPASTPLPSPLIHPSTSNSQFPSQHPQQMQHHYQQQHHHQQHHHQQQHHQEQQHQQNHPLPPISLTTITPLDAVITSVPIQSPMTSQPPLRPSPSQPREGVGGTEYSHTQYLPSISTYSSSLLMVAPHPSQMSSHSPSAVSPGYSMHSPPLQSIYNAPISQSMLSPSISLPPLHVNTGQQQQQQQIATQPLPLKKPPRSRKKPSVEVTTTPLHGEKYTAQYSAASETMSGASQPGSHTIYTHYTGEQMEASTASHQQYTTGSQQHLVGSPTSMYAVPSGSVPSSIRQHPTSLQLQQQEDARRQRERSQHSPAFALPQLPLQFSALPPPLVPPSPNNEKNMTLADLLMTSKDRSGSATGRQPLANVQSRTSVQPITQAHSRPQLAAPAHTIQSVSAAGYHTMHPGPSRVIIAPPQQSYNDRTMLRANVPAAQKLTPPPRPPPPVKLPPPKPKLTPEEIAQMRIELQREQIAVAEQRKRDEERARVAREELRRQQEEQQAVMDNFKTKKNYLKLSNREQIIKEFPTLREHVEMVKNYCRQIKIPFTVDMVEHLHETRQEVISMMKKQPRVYVPKGTFKKVMAKPEYDINAAPIRRFIGLAEKHVKLNTPLPAPALFTDYYPPKNVEKEEEENEMNEEYYDDEDEDLRRQLGIELSGDYAEGSSIPSDDGIPILKIPARSQHRRMNGIYRKIPEVDKWANMVEDADYDAGGMFPNGLEDFGLDDEDYDHHLKFLKGPFRHVREDKGPAELYLRGKELEYESKCLKNMTSICKQQCAVTAKYPNAVGRALRDRDRRHPRPEESIIAPIRRCKHIISGDEHGKEAKRCIRPALPLANHCARHILHSTSQRQYSYCMKRFCGRAVNSVDTLVWDGMCHQHRETRQNKYDQKNVMYHGQMVDPTLIDTQLLKKDLDKMSKMMGSILAEDDGEEEMDSDEEDEEYDEDEEYSVDDELDQDYEEDNLTLVKGKHTDVDKDKSQISNLDNTNVDTENKTENMEDEKKKRKRKFKKRGQPDETGKMKYGGDGRIEDELYNEYSHDSRETTDDDDDEIMEQPPPTPICEQDKGEEQVDMVEGELELEEVEHEEMDEMGDEQMGDDDEEDLGLAEDLMDGAVQWDNIEEFLQEEGFPSDAFPVAQDDQID